MRRYFSHRLNLLRSTVLTLVMLLAVSANAQPPAAPITLPVQTTRDPTVLHFEDFVVAADHPRASEAGASILKKGGNAVDAAVATSFALSVTRPASCGIGGGGFMVIWDSKSQRAVALDYREQAPAAATRDMFAQPPKGTEAGSVRGGMAVGIPGNVAGLCYAAEHYGTLPLAELLKPAIRLAEEGVPIDAHDRSAQSLTLAKFDRYPDYQKRFAALKKLYLNDGIPWKKGDRFFSPLAPVLKKIASNGVAGFYEGDVANSIVNTVKQAGGILTADDLQAINVKLRIPLQDEYRGQTIYTMPPASSGGIALLQTLQAIESWESNRRIRLESLRHNSPDYIHVVAEAMKHAFADRAEFLGDTDFVSVPVEKLISREYSAEIASKIDQATTLNLTEYGRFFAEEDGGTSHFSVIDSSGNAVACTETINLTYGSFVVVPKYGILLNNEIDDFAARPGKPNAFGLLQSEANCIAPGKRPLSSMTPTIVVRDGRATYSTGASGGPKIITATIQSVLNHLVFGMPPHRAVSAPRFHHQWSPNILRLEESLYFEVAAEMKKRGHEVTNSSGLGACQSVSADGNNLTGGSDPRKHGHPSGH